ALGRPVTGGGNKTVNMFPVTGLLNTTSVALFGGGAVTGDRLNQLDLRFSRIVRLGRNGSIDLNFDIYNTFNDDAVLGETTGYSGVNGGAWLKPTSVLQGRIFKFGARWDFWSRSKTQARLRKGAGSPSARPLLSRNRWTLPVCARPRSAAT